MPLYWGAEAAAWVITPNAAAAIAAGAMTFAALWAYVFGADSAVNPDGSPVIVEGTCSGYDGTVYELGT